MFVEACIFNGGGGGGLGAVDVLDAERSADLRDGDMGGQHRADG